MLAEWEGKMIQAMIQRVEDDPAGTARILTGLLVNESAKPASEMDTSMLYLCGVLLQEASRKMMDEAEAFAPAPPEESDVNVEWLEELLAGVNWDAPPDDAELVTEGQ